MNESVISGLNPADKVEGIYAYLVDELNKSVFTFLYNPEEKSFNRQAKYDEGTTALTSTPAQFYRCTKGLTLQITDLILESYSRRKSCQLLLDRLQALMIADPENGKYAPSPVYFKWGKDSFGPAVITDLSWKETSWLNGEVASARVDITFLEIPLSQLPNKAVAESSENRLRAAMNKSMVLTDRQKEDAASKAKKWLNQNIKKLPETISSLIRINSYKLSTSNSGVVTLFNSKSQTLGTIGIYKDGKLNTNSNAWGVK